MSEGSNKRQRQAGSFSPVSPPFYEVAKTSDQQTKPAVLPRSPTSPPHMSSTSQPNGSYSSFATTQDAASTPPSSVPMSAQPSQQPFQNLPTPAHSVKDVSSFAVNDSDGDEHMTDDLAGSEPHRIDSDVEMQEAGEHRHTGHERQWNGLWHGFQPSEELWKEMRDVEILPPLKQCEMHYPRSDLHPSQDLVNMLGLRQIQERFRRNDPTTKEKIEANKVRSSYVGKLKSLQIAGKNKASKKPDGQEGLFEIANTAPFVWDGVKKPEEIGRMLNKTVGGPLRELYSKERRILETYNPADKEALNQEVNSLTGKLGESLAQYKGKDVTGILSDSFSAKLDKALRMAPGKYTGPDHGEYRRLIGTEEGPKAKAVEGVKKGNSAAVQAHSSPAGQTPSAPSPVMRSSRPGAKRSYDEASFRGYGEGFPDDDGGVESAGGEDSRRRASGSQKKRRKEIPAGSPLGGSNFSLGIKAGR